jgi:hypothetical protein
MKFRIAMAIAFVFLFAQTVGVAFAQETASAAKKPAKSTSAKVRVFTGCLQKGDEAGEFNFVAKDGSTWEVESKTLKLDEHVGHTVKITGRVSNPQLHAMKEGVKEGAEKVGVTKEAKEHGHLTVTKLTHISDTCKQ